MISKTETIKLLKAFRMDVTEFNLAVFEVVAQVSHDNVVKELRKPFKDLKRRRALQWRKHE